MVIVDKVWEVNRTWGYLLLRERRFIYVTDCKNLMSARTSVLSSGWSRERSSFGCAKRRVRTRRELVPTDLRRCARGQRSTELPAGYGVG
jgi:hypothetical protein